jgi:hypothetical protein
MNAKSINQKFDFMLIGFCLLIMAWAGRELWFVPLTLTESNNQTPLAELATKNQQVVWKQSESLAWHQGNIGEEFFQGDEIFTYDGATATLDLARLGIVALGPKTLLKLEKNEDGISGINIEKGSITLSLKADQSVILKAGGNKLRLKNSPSASQIKLVQNGQTPALTVLSGEVELRQEKKSEGSTESFSPPMQLKENQQFELEPVVASEEPTAVEIALVFAMPPLLAESNLQIEANRWPLSLKLPLTWPEGEKTVTATSLQQDFFLLIKNADGITSEKLKLPYQLSQLELKLPTLSSYQLQLEEWRDGTIFQTLNFAKLQFNSPPPLEAVALISPGHLADLYQLEKNLQLSWQPVERSSGYEVEIQTNRGKKRLIPSLTNNLQLKAEAAESYRWRTRALIKSELIELLGEWSEEREFHFFPLGAQARSPKEGLRMELKTPDEKISLAWAAIETEQIKHYLVEIATAQDFANIVKSYETKQTNLGFTLGKSGIFYWRTKVINQTGKVSYSRPIQVEIIPGKAPPPPAIPKIKKIKIKPVGHNSMLWQNLGCLLIACAQAESEAELPKVLLEWDEVKEAKGYRVEIYQDENQKVLLFKGDVKVNQLSWSPPRAGTYFWRLASLDPWNRPLLYSPLAQLVLEIEKTAPPPISSPELLAQTQIRRQAYSKNSQLYLGKLRLGLVAGTNNWTEESTQHRIDYSGWKSVHFQLSFAPAFLLLPDSRFTYSFHLENQTAEIDSNKEFRRRQLYAESGWRFGHALVQTLTVLVGHEMQTTFPLNVATNPNSGLLSQEESKILYGLRYQGSKKLELKNYLNWSARYTLGVLSGFSLSGHYGFEYSHWNLEAGLFYQSYSRELRQAQFDSVGLSLGFVF